MFKPRRTSTTGRMPLSLVIKSAAGKALGWGKIGEHVRKKRGPRQKRRLQSVAKKGTKSNVDAFVRKKARKSQEKARSSNADKFKGNSTSRGGVKWIGEIARHDPEANKPKRFNLGSGQRRGE